MEKEEKKAVDEFLGDLKQDSNDPFEETQEDVFKEEEETKDEPQHEEEPDKIPFHKNPKVKKFIEKEVEKKLQGLHIKPVEQEQIIKQAEDDGDFVTAFEAIMGNDTPEKREALSKLRTFTTKLHEEATAMKREREEEQRAEEEATRQLESGFEAIEDTFNIELSGKLRTEYIDFMQRVAPKDAHGDIVAYPDFITTFELFQESRKRPNTVAREKASRSITRSGDASVPQKQEDQSWNAVDRIFSKL